MMEEVEEEEKMLSVFAIIVSCDSSAGLSDEMRFKYCTNN